jgi:uncharacterized membrane protein YgaE (UPF0421/DUF939 family)
MVIKFNKIGMRTLKTGLAVIVTLLVSQLLEISNPFFATIAAIFAMESSISATFTAARDRMYGTVLGAIVAFIFSMLIPVNAMTIGIGIVIVIYICNAFKWQGTIKISTIVFLAILLGFEEGGQFEYALFRTMDTFIGLAISTLINYFVFPHNVGEKVTLSIDEIVETLNEMMSAIDKHSESFDLELFDRDLSVMKAHFDTLQKEIKLMVYPKYDMMAVKQAIDKFDGIYHHMAILDTLFEESDSEQVSIIKAYHIDKIKTMIKSFELLSKR